jgi:ATP-dependent DNA helicase RecQ
VATLSRWSKVWAQRPGCVIPVPASDMALNRQLAAHIARIGRLPLHEPLTWNGPPLPLDSASAPNVVHLESVLCQTPDIALPNGPVLLVSTTVRTRWTASVSAAMLHTIGVKSALLLALHLQP